MLQLLHVLTNTSYCLFHYRLPPRLARTTSSSTFWLQLGVLVILKVSLCTLAVNWISEKEFGWSRKNCCQLKRCAMRELGVKFYLGQNEDCRLGDSTSDSLRDCSEEAVGESQYIRFWWRGSSIQSSTYFINTKSYLLITGSWCRHEGI